MANDITNTPPVPPVAPVVQEGKQGTDAQKKDIPKQKKQQREDDISLDEWSEDHTKLSLKAIELQIIEDVNTLLKRYTDEVEAEEHDDALEKFHEGFHPAVPSAYEAYKKMTHNFAETPHQVRSPFLPVEPQGLSPEELEEYTTLKKYWDDIEILRAKGLEHIDYNGEDSFYEALERFVAP